MSLAREQRPVGPGSTPAIADVDRRSADLLDSMSDALFECDNDWTLVLINQAARDLIGRAGSDPDRAVGRPVWEVFPALAGTELHTRVQQLQVDRRSFRMELQGPYSGRWFSIYAFPASVGVGVFTSDITEQKTSEQNAYYLAESSKLLGSSLDLEETLSNVASLLVPERADACTIDLIGPDGQPVRVATAMADQEREERLREWRRNIPIDTVLTHPIHRVLQTGEPYFRETVTDDDLLEVAGGNADLIPDMRAHVWTSCIIVSLTAHTKTVGALALGMTDGRKFTEADLDLARELAHRAALSVENARLYAAAENARREAEAANQAKSDFLRTMSHELRTPLNAIAGYTELLESGVRGPMSEVQLQDLGRIRTNQRHLLALINDVLNFARLEKGHVEFNIEEFEIDPGLAAIEALVLPQLGARNLRYLYAPCAAGLSCRADPERVRQILLNLLSNAIKFTPMSGTVMLSCEADESNVRIQVRDTGRGIPAEKQNSVFEPFIQLDRNLSQPVDGTGLGLSISRDLARAMGGDLGVESQVGAGSVFTLTLPRS